MKLVRKSVRLIGQIVIYKKVSIYISSHLFLRRTTAIIDLARSSINVEEALLPRLSDSYFKRATAAFFTSSSFSLDAIITEFKFVNN